MKPLDVGEPTVVGPYRLLGRLGSGGMGRVYLGRSAGGRTVAVKVVHPHFALDEEFRARFRREVEAARRVGGAWTAPVLDADPEASVPWVATGYAAGPSLAAAVSDGGPLPPHTVRVLGAGLAEALSAVHALGLVHRDVKPSNVLLTVDGPLLIDFGIARATDGTASLTSTGVSIGSPGYMSPEQILGKGVTGAADVFSLGAVLAYAATGESPFPGDSSAALLYKVVHEEPQLGDMEGDLRELVERCLMKDAAARPTPDEVARALAPAGAARLVTAGWLPGPLVEQVGRSAVQLLNLEAVDDGEGTPASGPVEFSRPSVGESGAVPAVPSAGEAVGEAVVPSAGGAVAVPAAPAGAEVPAAGGVFGPPPVMSPEQPVTHVPGQRADVATADTVRPSPAGKVSLSVAATSTTEANGRGRKVSCTVALAVAGAFAAVSVGSVFMFGMLRDSDDTSNDAGPPVVSPSALPTSEDPRGDQGGESAGQGEQLPAGVVPEKFLGTWEGDGYALGGKLPAGTFTVTLEQAAVGEKLGTFRSVDLLGGACDDKLVLKEASEVLIVATSIPDKDNNPSTCVKNTHEITLTPVGKELEYASDNADAGDPTARMAKVK
ncbi:serine/threonine protein kinase [Streptomyces ipomoeae]|uniref:Kinase domain protein n=2 Tax=Streptomyces ipomoeae TaxID=103232 RepID=L1KJ54_9ACTN|nr:serine/threonine-protein kinase [Streptomyces ipomoeae]EKX60510.1 kinase domain protein [Streptomyces ipomoeae 91-03]MDX2698307.1 serine/threonine-protein kinase [Streptomyces ipomoeae]MDX2827494.1 serine/threonine-protein kinase [Streptomyces ipomoeae]MDX2844177.1 serine/threonine-protein kinase [Streptomyces ipomoeae]MDX2881092.1 serine/threonine-protein kinase [Streptomyces ipomoeae]